MGSVLERGILLFSFFILIHENKACQNNWVTHGSKCYFFSHGQLSWVEAFEMCKIIGGILVEISTEGEKEFIDRKVVELKRGVFWIGAHDSAEENQFVWATSRIPLSVKHFASNNPDNSMQNENCVEINPDGFWNDLDCSEKRQFICEAGQEPPSIG